MPRRTTGTPRLLAPVAVLIALTLAGCGSDDTDATATGSSETDAARARERVAAFTCPERASTAGEDRDGPADGERLRVRATVAPLTSMVANIAGDLAEVHGLVPEGVNSHTFEPQPSMAADLTDADVLFVNGLQLEEPTKELAETNLPDDGQLVELGTLTLDEDQYLYDFSFPREGGKPNPHLWTNPPMARCYAETVASVLAKADPANAEAYEANLADYAAKIDDLDRRMAEATATVPAEHRQLLTYHDAYAYFAAHYGWTVVGAVQPSDFEEPSPKEVADLIDQVRDEDIPAVFGSEVFPSDVLEQIADEAGATYVDVLRDDDLPGEPGDERHSYLALMQFDFVTMVDALGGDPAVLEAFDPADTAPDTATYPQ
jgi:ABC-type Zn uptake system ZnuABC Zn-binding protein ZnuA